MSQLFHGSLFSDFGPSQFLPPSPGYRVVRIEGATAAALRVQVKLLAPQRPGVYGMLDGEDQLLYIGKAKNLRRRLQSYFRRKGRPRKAGKVIALARRILCEIVPSEFGGLLRELELIRRWRPRWNVQGQPLRRRLAFVCVGRAPAPYVYLSRKITPRVQAAFGPVTAGKRAREAVRRLNDGFGLRDCPRPQEMIFPDEKELFAEVRAPGCLRMEIGACLGPCTGACPRPDYQQQVRRARAFLAGDDLAPLAQLQKQMEEAAAAQRFEVAASLRDRWTLLTWLADALRRARQGRQEMSFIYPVAGFDGDVCWYFIHGARTVAMMHAPRDETQWSAAVDMIKAIYLDQSGLLDSYEHADSMMLVMSWFRQHPGERTRCLSPEKLARRPAHGQIRGG